MPIGATVSTFGNARTVRDLILKAYAIAKVLGRGEQISDELLADGGNVLNDIIEQTTINKLFTVFQTEIPVPLVSNTITYTVGPSSASPIPDVIANRPVQIISGYARREQIDYSLFITHQKEDYDRVVLKGLLIGGWTTAIYYQAAHPAGTIYVYPVPADSATTLYLTVESALSPYSSFEEDVLLPPVYYAWLQYKLASRLAPDHGQLWSDDNREILQEMETAITHNNLKPSPTISSGLVALASGRSAYNIISDSVRS